MTKAEQAEKGRRSDIAMKELENAFEVLEQQCFEKFKESSVHDKEGHMAICMYLRVMDDLRDRFELAIVNGEAARKELVKLV